MEYRGTFIAIVVALLLVFIKSYGDETTENIKIAWDYRDSKYKAIEFIHTDTNLVRIYSTKEDISKKHIVSGNKLTGEIIHLILEK